MPIVASVPDISAVPITSSVSIVPSVPTATPVPAVTVPAAPAAPIVVKQPQPTKPYNGQTSGSRTKNISLALLFVTVRLQVSKKHKIF